MRLLIVNTLPVPSGQASVNRILSLGKGLVEVGDQVTILSSSKTNDTEFHTIDGIQYANIAHYKCKIIRLIESLLKILVYIRRNRFNIDVIWVVSNSPLLIFPLWFASKMNHIKYVMEKSEFPFVLMKRGLIAKIWGKIYINTIYKLFDGMIIMTQPLLDFFKKNVRKDCLLIKVPMTVDVTRFDNVIINNEYGSYAAYCGNMSGNKDGVENLIEAFSYVEPYHPDLKLVMVGNADTLEELERIKDKVRDLKLNNVVFTGQLPRENIPGILMNAKMLCLARPSGLQSLGGFPTKLGEYLATGLPVVVTSVGEIPNYLNSDNAYIVSPDDNKKFGEAMNGILSDYDNATHIGMRGRDVVLRTFNYSIQATRLHDFFIKLLSDEKQWNTGSYD